jgi:hypothetical protein
MKKIGMKMNNPKSIDVPVWWDMGNGTSVRRDALPGNHPECTYNYIKNVLNLDPEDYGILHPVMGEYQNMTKEELLLEISKLKAELENAYKYI